MKYFYKFWTNLHLQKINYFVQITHHIFPNFKKSNYEEVLLWKSIFQKTHRPLLTKLQKNRKNYCSRLYKKERKNFFNKLNSSFVSEKLFWKTVKPFFSNNGSHRVNIKLVEGDKLLQDDSEVVEELNNFFKHVVSTIYINENSHVIIPDSVKYLRPYWKTCK